MPASSLVILGAGGHGVSAYNVAVSAGFVVSNFVDPALRGRRIMDTETVGDLSEIADTDGLHVCIAIGDNDHRSRVQKELLIQYPDVSFPSLIHASAVIIFICADWARDYRNAGIGNRAKYGNRAVLYPQYALVHRSRLHNGRLFFTGAGCHHWRKSAYRVACCGFNWRSHQRRNHNRQRLRGWRA